MKNYAYTAKDATGALTRGILSAADRAAALEALRSQGLMPVKVEETSTAPAGRRTVPPRVLAYAAIVLILLAGGVWRVSSRRGRQRPVKQPPAAGERASPQAATKPVARPAPSDPVQPRPAESVPSDLSVPSAPPPAVATPTAPTTTAPASQPKRKALRIDAILDMSTNTPSGYSSGTEKVINMIVNTRPGSMPPPLLRLPKGENIAEILNRDIIVFDDDSEKTVAEKENVAYAKTLLKAYIDGGGNAEDFLDHYHKTLSDAFNERQASQKYTMELLRAGDKEGAEKYMAEKNEELKAKGIMPIQIPKFMRR